MIRMGMETDVLIIGSGPAGASAAYHLGGYPGRVTVLERLSPAMFGRYHSVCGEAVSDRMLRRAGISTGAVVSRVDRIRISYPGGASVEIPVEGSVVDRPAMLEELRSGSSAEFVRGTALSVRRSGEGFEVETTAGRIHCRFLIGADGAHSVVRRDLFGSRPEMLPVVNSLVPGQGGPVLDFEVSSAHPGFYAWRFPSRDGLVSVGAPKGEPIRSGAVESGARHLPFGGVPETVSGNAVLVGDAAGLANALCYGGIGMGLLSGRKAAEAIADGRLGRYSGWCRRSLFTSPRFMEAHRRFSSWTDGDIQTAMRPFRSGYSVGKGLLAILRHPGYANVYFATWLAFRIGW